MGIIVFLGFSIERWLLGAISSENQGGAIAATDKSNELDEQLDP